MTLSFQELDYQNTNKGELILQRRLAADLDNREVFEVKLNDEYLMSSLFVDGEEALTRIGLESINKEDAEVVVGGLGLGYTAAEVLKYKHVSSLTVVEALEPVIRWHKEHLVPNGERLSNDPRCTYHNADFFTLAGGNGFHPEVPAYEYDAILLDIDHTPSALLNPSHADFYSKDGLTRLATFMKPGGVFALWSNEAPDDDFLALMQTSIGPANGHVIEFDNPIRRSTEINGVYVATKPQL